MWVLWVSSLAVVVESVDKLTLTENLTNHCCQRPLVLERLVLLPERNMLSQDR